MSSKYLGIYSTVENSLPGAGGGSGIIKKYWFAWEWDTGTVAVQSMNGHMKPEGLPKILVYAAFDSSFSRDDIKSSLPEPPSPVAEDPLGLQASHTSASAEGSEDENKLKEVKPQFIEELDFGETKYLNNSRLGKGQEREGDAFIKEAENMARTVFSEGLSHLQNGFVQKAMSSLEEPLLMDIAWRPRHKHMFSDFGIILRKVQVLELSLRYHSKALSLSPNEVNILFNIARVHLCLGDSVSARKCVSSILETKPNMREALLLKEYIDKTGQSREM